ncbi:MAG: aspartate kinase [Calditrichaceae bacterium]
MIIIKFGGTSVKDASAIQNACNIIKDRLDKQPVVVSSALAGITDLLLEALEAASENNEDKVLQASLIIKQRHIEIIDKLIRDESISKSLKDMVEEETGKLHVLLKAARTIRLKSGAFAHAVMSIGEILSTKIITGYLNDSGITACWIDAREVIVLEEKKDEFIPDIKAIKQKTTDLFEPLFSEHRCAVFPGFIGATKEGEPATLGRNGSDYSASILGAAINAEEIQIWSDVDGILSADPTIIPYAKPLKTMTFDEACELAYFGARVLHPASIQPALEKGIPVGVLNSNRPMEPGTMIVASDGNQHTGRIVKSIAYKESITLLTVESTQLLLSPKIIEEIFLILSRHGKRVYAVSKTATKLSITIENKYDLSMIVNEISELGEVTAEQGKVIVSVVGEKMKGHPSLPWQILKLLDENKIKFDLVTQFASQISLVFIIDENEIKRTVKLLHKSFIENKK